MKEVICLRPHHGMCLAYFRGEGYSEGFIAHMASVKAVLEAGARIRVTDSADRICQGCPNRRGTDCLTQEKVCRYDRQVLALCGLTPGDEMPYADFAQMVYGKILQPGLREEICGDCQWNHLCR